MSKEKFTIGIDLGGTKIISLLGNSQGVKCFLRTQTPKEESQIVQKILELVKNLMKRGKIERKDLLGVAIGVAGLVDSSKGIIVFTPNLPFENFPLLKVLKRYLKLPFVLENDANCFVLGEQRFGSGKGGINLIGITLGTGIGGGIIINNQLYRGQNFGGEIGHMIIKEDGPICNCGNKGCLEALASGKAIERIAKERVNQGRKSLILKLASDKEKITCETVSEAAKRGDSLGVEIFQEAGKFLGIGIANLINIFHPEKVILGGGMIQVRELFFSTLLEMVKKNVIPAILKKVEIVPANLGEKGVALGAMSLFWR